MHLLSTEFLHPGKQLKLFELLMKCLSVELTSYRDYYFSPLRTPRSHLVKQLNRRKPISLRIDRWEGLMHCNERSWEKHIMTQNQMDRETYHAVNQLRRCFKWFVSRQDLHNLSMQGEAGGSMIPKGPCILAKADISHWEYHWKWTSYVLAPDKIK